MKSFLVFQIYKHLIENKTIKIKNWNWTRAKAKPLQLSYNFITTRQKSLRYDLHYIEKHELYKRAHYQCCVQNPTFINQDMYKR